MEECRFCYPPHPQSLVVLVVAVVLVVGLNAATSAKMSPPAKTLTAKGEVYHGLVFTLSLLY